MKIFQASFLPNDRKTEALGLFLFIMDKILFSFFSPTYCLLEMYVNVKKIMFFLFIDVVKPYLNSK